MTFPDISHLRAHTVIFVVPPDQKKGKPEIKYSVEVSYSNHCYTKSMRSERGEKTEVREFDETRYELSKRLPEIVSGLMNRKCSFAQERNLNYFTVDAGPDGEYEIYFEVFKKPGTKTLGLRVQSAYVRDQDKLSSRPRWRAIKFSVILFNVLHDKPIKAPR